jgi:hypothetical protein
MENDKNRDYGQNRSPQQPSQSNSKRDPDTEPEKLRVEKDHTVESRLNSENSDTDVDTDEESMYRKDNKTDEATTTEDITGGIGNLSAEDIERDLIKKGFNKDDRAGTASNRYH